VWPKPNVTEIARAVGALEAGKPIVLPTDTVYGVAALPGVPGAVDALFRIKERREGKPIAILAGGLAAMAGIGVIDAGARSLGERFWPGPLTLVLPRAPGFEIDLGGGTGVGVRVPDCAPALDLLGLTGPLAVTSANRSGEKPATTVAEARDAFGAAVDVYIDGGKCDGLPSTVVSLLGLAPEILRPGPIDVEEIIATVSGTHSH
jgi:L-threonylcarbamoyladenylate synthase